MLSRSEIQLVERYNGALERHKSIQKRVENDMDVLNFYVNRNISDPTFEITVSKGTLKSSQQRLMKLFSDVRVKFIEAPVSRKERDRFWQQIRLELLYRDFKSDYPTPLIDSWDIADVSLIGAKLGGSDWRVHLKVLALTAGTASVVSKSSGSTIDGVELFTISVGQPRTKRQAAPDRASISDMARGGKEMRALPNGDGVCTSGPVVTSNSDVVILTAGHCTDADALGTGLAGIGSTPALLDLSCDRCVTPGPDGWPLNDPPIWWWGIGVDVALYLPTWPTPAFANGAGRSQYLTQFGSPSFSQQLGSTDPYNGQQMVCIEGASSSKRPPSFSSPAGQNTHCGWSDGVFFDDFRSVVLWNGSVSCGGDSGAVTTVGGYVTGVFSASHGGEDWNNDPNCDISTADSPIDTVIGSFWKIHQYLYHYHGITSWVLTY
jgi:hypothetical protein